MREVVSCCKGEWKAIQEKSFSKSDSENEGFIIQKTPNPWNRYFEPQHFFFLLPILPSLLQFYSYVPLFLFSFFNTNIYFYFNYNTPEKRARARERVAKTECRVGVGGNGGWWVSKLLFGGHSDLVIATVNGGFRCQFGFNVEEQFNPSPRFPNIWFFFLRYNIIDCVFCCDGAFLALHVKFRYLVFSLALWDCLLKFICHVF